MSGRRASQLLRHAGKGLVSNRAAVCCTSLAQPAVALPQHAAVSSVAEPAASLARPQLPCVANLLPRTLLRSGCHGNAASAMPSARPPAEVISTLHLRGGRRYSTAGSNEVPNIFVQHHVNLSGNGIDRVALRNASLGILYEDAIKYDGGKITSTGALQSYSYEKTGRSPEDKRIVDEPGSRNDVWWGSINMPISDDVFSANRSRAVDYLSTCERLYVVDGYAGWDEKYRIKVRVITARPYHAIFMHNMLIRPTAEQLARDFGADFVPDGRSRFVIYNAGAFPADSSMEGAIARGSKTRVALSFERGEMVILGTHYAGEMKKGVFTVMNYLMPKAGALPMHASANEARDGSSSSVFFGLSGTGKTTLSADPKRNLIGDDEIVWSEDGLSNIEGGCYAKTVDLSPVKEPEIFGAVRYGAVLENTVMDASTRVVDYTDTSLTQNTRVSYPIDFIPNAKVPCLGTMPKHIVFLACDAFGVLPPVSKLTPEQAEYHFISGYSAKVAGTEMGVREPVPVFSACFGAPFMVWHPGVYARLLSERMRKHSTSAWLVNTGWSGGAYATGSRMPLAYTRAIIDAINDDKLDAVPTITEPVFGLAIPMDVPGVPTEMLVPRQAWSYPGGGEEYDRTAAKLAGLFVRNFDKYVSGVSEAVLQGGPSAIMLAHEAEAPEQHQQQRMAASL